MNLLYIGSGFVGACSAAVSVSSGHNVLVYDIDENKIKMLGSGDRDMIESCLYEKGLGDLLVRNFERIKFTTDYNLVENFLNDCDAVFMCLPTPEIDKTGESNLEYYFDAAEKLAEALIKRDSGSQSKYVVIINKSTVPITMADKSKEIFDKVGVKNYGVVSNPEFLVEGKAITGSLNPDRVVIGAETEKDFILMRNIYERFYSSPNVDYIEVNQREAAAGKLLANFILFNKLQICFDVIGRTCETFSDLQFENIRKILATDPRIGDWGMYNSLYAGGSCLIKDSRSLLHQLNQEGQATELINETYSANYRQLYTFLNRADKEAGFSFENKVVALMGVAFKRDTNDIRNSASVEIVKFLVEKKVKQIKIYDPTALELFKEVFAESGQIKYCNNELDCILPPLRTSSTSPRAGEETSGVDVVIISTDWPQFRELDKILMQLPDKPLLMDGRRILSHKYKELQEVGCDIIAVGSPFLKSK